MSFLGNIIWLIFGGFIAGMGYILGGLSLCLTIIGIPFGVQMIKNGWVMFMPFGKEVVQAEESKDTLYTVFNIIWLVLFGWELVLIHAFHGAILAITIIGIPFAKQHFKLIPIAALPFGRTLE